MRCSRQSTPEAALDAVRQLRTPVRWAKFPEAPLAPEAGQILTPSSTDS